MVVKIVSRIKGREKAIVMRNKGVETRSRMRKLYNKEKDKFCSSSDKGTVMVNKSRTSTSDFFNLQFVEDSFSKIWSACWQH